MLEKEIQDFICHTMYLEFIRRHESAQKNDQQCVS